MSSDQGWQPTQTYRILDASLSDDQSHFPYIVIFFPGATTLKGPELDVNILSSMPDHYQQEIALDSVIMGLIHIPDCLIISINIKELLSVQNGLWWLFFLRTIWIYIIKRLQLYIYHCYLTSMWVHMSQ